MTADLESSALLRALVVTPSLGGYVESVVVAFVNSHEADEFARRHGLGARVVPMHFAVEMDRERMGDAPAAGRVAR